MPERVTLFGSAAKSFLGLKPGTSLTARLVARIVELRESEDGVQEITLELGDVDVTPGLEKFSDAGSLALALHGGRDAYEEYPG